jgi:RNA polymerase sigma-70 factor (ECF subfamily)
MPPSGSAMRHNPPAMDRDTLDRFRLGDQEAVRAVYDRFSGPLFTLAMSMLGDRDLAADAVQQTVVKAWKAAATYDADRELAPWLYSIARRACIDLYRRERIRRHDELDGDEIVTLPPDIEVAWEAYEVRMALDQLADDERTVVRLMHFEGFSQPEIGERLGIPVGTVKSRAHRAHRKLSVLLRHVLETA